MDNPLNYLNTMKSFLKIKASSSDSEEKVYTLKDFFTQCEKYVDSLIKLIQVCPFVLEANNLEGNLMEIEGIECEYTELEDIYLFKPKHEVSDREYSDLHVAVNELVEKGAINARFVFVLSYDFDVFTTKIKDKAKEGN